MWRICAEIIGAVFCLFAFWKWSKARAEKRFEEKKADDIKEDLEISAKPFVDRPLSRMRFKKK